MKTIEGVSLKPCPFCGNAATITANDEMCDSAAWDFYVGCSVCEIQMSSGWTYDYDKGHLEIVAIWNSRMAPHLTKVTNDEEKEAAQSRLDEIDALRRISSTEREEYDRIERLIDDYLYGD